MDRLSAAESYHERRRMLRAKNTENEEEKKVMLEARQVRWVRRQPPTACRQVVSGLRLNGY
ncbi:hypothetical protein E2C01_097901 [Portunus trituberculatus]|uniref:Uncharacterized protein n=1 Tax=Portunus trituberculatus TaxID=210409 RepID=A0A5B7K6V3_PORTR|nr:hypothetical protein [Portunus trituberculatus]